MAEKGFKGLKVYRLAYSLAIKVFELSKDFPKEERYSLTDQIRRSSRSVCANIAEGYRKRIYPKQFKNKMSDADAEASETMVWLDFAKDSKYISFSEYKILHNEYEEAGRMLGSMTQNPNKFLPGRN